MIRRFACAGVVLALCACKPQAESTAETPPIPRAPATIAAPSTAPAALANDADPATADQSAESTFELPGAFAPDTSVVQLEQRFGKANVQVGDVPGAEGETSRGVILFPNDATQRAYLYYQDEDKPSGLQLVRVLDEGSRWHFADGVRIGMPLSRLVALNGKPIRFYGFDWDYGGTITDWNGGKLAPAGAKDAISLGIRLNRIEDAPDKSYPIGEGEFASGDRRYPKLGSIAIVGEISVSFPGEDDL
ncbi:MAG: hypothetical protein QM719_10715 [Thermomonas sp.]